MPDLFWYIIAGAGVVVLAVFLYGVFRKFTRVSWLSWQIAIVFGATFLVGYLPVPGAAWGKFAVAAGLIAGASAVVLIVGGIVRHAMLARMRPAPLVIRFFSRLLGGATAVLNVGVFLLTIGLPVLAALSAFNVQIEALSALYAHPVWQFIAPHALDLLVVAVCLLMMRAGYRIGLARSICTILMLALGVGALVLSVFLAARVPFLAQFAATIASSLPETLGAAASLIGTIAVAAICFVVLLVAIVLIALLVNLLVRNLKGNPVLGAIDGALMALVFTALFFVIACAVDFGVSYLAANAASLPMAETIAPIAQALENFFLSSPISSMLYEGNIIAALLP